jgi:hypothetical protein
VGSNLLTQTRNETVVSSCVRNLVSKKRKTEEEDAFLVEEVGLSNLCLRQGSMK